MRVLVLLALAFVAVAAVPTSERIIGGSYASVTEYPSIVALLHSTDLTTYSQACGGIIINYQTILTAGHCLWGDAVNKWRARVGSSYGDSGGIVHTLQSFLFHPEFNAFYSEHDIAIIRPATQIAYNNAAQPATIAGTNYIPPDNSVVWAAGWGSTVVDGPRSPQLRAVQMWTVNQRACFSNYVDIGIYITDTMLCAGWLDVGGRDQCQGDAGGPLYHNGVVVGVGSFRDFCALPRYPGINVRISEFTTWIQANA